MIIFRVDSSSEIGAGHLVRCFSLAEYLQNIGKTNIGFISRDLKGNLNYLIKNKGYQLFQLPEIAQSEELSAFEEWGEVKLELDLQQTKEILQNVEADCLIIDHYGINVSWEEQIRPYVKKTMVIDDLANQKHDCDILLNQTFNIEKTNKYSTLIPQECQLFLGIEYVLLRKQFYRIATKKRVQSDVVRRVLVFYGSGDDTGETIKVLVALQKLRLANLFVDVIVGESNKNRNLIREMCNSMEYVDFHCQVDNMASFIERADIVFAASGSNTWERCILGVPSIVTVTAENQVGIAEEVSRSGAIYNLGWYEKVKPGDYLKIFRSMNALDLKSMSTNALKIIGDSKISEVAHQILLKG